VIRNSVGFMSNRIPKVNELIKQEIGKIIFEEEDFGRDVLVTVIDVETSIDCQHAAVRISVLPSQKSKVVLKKLNRHIYDLQKKLDKKLRMRPIPKIRFVLDISGSKIEKIDELIEKWHKE